MTSALVTRVNGPVVEVSAGDGLTMLDLVEVGPQRLPGEVIALDGASATVQVYEYTGGLRPGDEVVATGGPLAGRLGPGLLGGVFDGVLRPRGRADRARRRDRKRRRRAGVALHPACQLRPRTGSRRDFGKGARDRGG